MLEINASISTVSVDIKINRVSGTEWLGDSVFTDLASTVVLNASRRHICDTAGVLLEHEQSSLWNVDYWIVANIKICRREQRCSGWLLWGRYVTSLIV